MRYPPRLWHVVSRKSLRNLISSSPRFSLVDSSMLQFQTCYLMIYVLAFPILAGNQAMPSFLRFELWLFSKVVTPGSELDVLVHFLLTHSRR
jgi:Trk-type K+ transport system membrane component